MPRHFIKQASKLLLIDGSEVTSDIPIGCYTLQTSPTHGFHLVETDYPSLPDPLFGDMDAITEHVHRAFDHYDKGSLGVLFSGNSGAGKTIQAKHIISQRRFPAVLVTECLTGKDFLEFVSKLPPCYLFLDEWDKHYTEDDERACILQLLEGSGNGRHLVLMTSNSESPGEFLEYRPGRIRYHYKYEALDRSVYAAFVNHFAPPSRVGEVLAYVENQPELSLDCVKALCEEVYIQEAPIPTIVKYLNVGTPPIKYDWEIQLRYVAAPVKDEDNETKLSAKLDASFRNGTIATLSAPSVTGAKDLLYRGYLLPVSVTTEQVPSCFKVIPVTIRGVFTEFDPEYWETNGMSIDAYRLPEILRMESYFRVTTGDVLSVTRNNGRLEVITQFAIMVGTPWKARAW
jgi:hypothetical protein